MDKSKIFDFILKFLRPKYYNRITWVVVVAGVSLVSTSLIEIILNEILKRRFDIMIISQQDALYGVILVALGLTYNLGIHYIELSRDVINSSYIKEERAKNLEHDFQIFRASNLILDESEINSILGRLDGGHEVQWDNIQKIWKYLDYFSLRSNEFLSSDLSALNKVHAEALFNLKEFIKLKFFSSKNDVKTYQLHPELNVERTTFGVTAEGEKRYYKLVEELDGLIQQVAESNRAYRRAIKETLRI
jgi:hypothetical protein